MSSEDKRRKFVDSLLELMEEQSPEEHLILMRSIKETVHVHSTMGSEEETITVILLNILVMIAKHDKCDGLDSTLIRLGQRIGDIVIEKNTVH